MKNKKLLLGIGALVLLLVAAALVRGGSRELPSVSTAKVTFRDLVERVSASGKIQPEIEVKITAEVNGQITQLPVKEGDIVAQGDLLVQLKEPEVPRDFEGRINQRAGALQVQQKRSEAVEDFLEDLV